MKENTKEDIKEEALKRISELKNIDQMINELQKTLKKKIEIDKCLIETNEKIKNILSSIDSTVLDSVSNRMFLKKNTLSLE